MIALEEENQECGVSQITTRIKFDKLNFLIHKFFYIIFGHCFTFFFTSENALDKQHTSVGSPLVCKNRNKRCGSNPIHAHDAAQATELER